MNKIYIFILIITFGIMFFVHYELTLERNNKLILFCESQEGKEQVDQYGPACYEFLKTRF